MGTFMNLLHTANKKIVIIIGLLVWSKSQAMIVGTTCLTLNDKNKIVLLYDRHALSDDDSIRSGHVNDMKTFINALTENEETVPFFVEISECHKDPIRRNNVNNMALSPSNVATLLALNNEMRYKNIEFSPFDSRKHCDYFMTEMMMDTDQFIQALNQDYAFPAHFYDITPEYLLKHLQDRLILTIKEINQLPVCQTTKDQDYAISKKRHDDCVEIISRLLKSYSANDKTHFIYLIEKLTNAEKNEFAMKLLEEQCFSVDINLLNDIIKKSQVNPLCVVLAGAYHSNNIEKRLLSQFSGFKKDVVCSMTQPGLKLDDLFNLKWPTLVPNNFINEKLMQFITIGTTKNEPYLSCTTVCGGILIISIAGVVIYYFTK